MEANDIDHLVQCYLSLEVALVRILDVVPFRAENESAYVPAASAIINEAGSLVSSTLFCEYDGTSKRPSITDLAPRFEQALGLSAKNTLFLRHPVRCLRPFENWTDPDGRYQDLDWWVQHNKAKHDRLRRGSDTTLQNAVISVCAAHQVLAVVPRMIRFMYRHGMLCYGGSGGTNPDWICEVVESGQCEKFEALVETRLFSTSIGRTDLGGEPAGIVPVIYPRESSLAKALGRQFT